MLKRFPNGSRGYWLRYGAMSQPMKDVIVPGRFGKVSMANLEGFRKMRPARRATPQCETYH